MITFNTDKEQIREPLLRLAIEGEKDELNPLYIVLKGIATEQGSPSENAAFLFRFLLALHHADSETKAAWIDEALTYIYQYTFIVEITMSRYIAAIEQGRDIGNRVDCLLVEEIDGSDHIDLDVPVSGDKPTAVGITDATGHVVLTVNLRSSKTGTAIEIFSDPQDPNISVAFKDESKGRKKGGKP
jgi:hypothetical protein